MQIGVGDFLFWYNGVMRGSVQGDVHPRSGRRTEAAVGAYLAWCGEQEINPRRWVLAKQDAIGWRFRIPIEHLPRHSAKFIENFRSWGDDKQAAPEGATKLSAAVVRDELRPSNKTVTYFSESIRRALQLEPEVCALHHATWYHPESVWCQACSKPCEGS